MDKRSGAESIGAKLPGSIGTAAQYLSARRKKMQAQLDAITGKTTTLPGTKILTGK
jgi:hypothetical protein